MKYLMRILYVLGGLALLSGVIIFFYAVNPDFSTWLSGIAGTQNVNQVAAETAGVQEAEREDESSEPAEPVLADTVEKDSLKGINVPDLPAEELYIIPDDTDIIVPENLSRRTGFVPIEETTEEIGDGQEESIQSLPGVGETGEGHNFDELIYPYYGMLSDGAKSIYRQIYANANALNDHFSPVADITRGEFMNAFIAVCNDHPELFWLETAYHLKLDRKGLCTEIKLKFNQTVDDLQSAKNLFESRCNEILSGVPEGVSDYDKEMYVHNALISQVEYQLSAPMNQSAYSAIVNGRTVCAGYARAFQYLMQQLGIPCYYCTGYAGEAHAWNIIKLDDGYYNVDTTWDDTDPNTLDFFNRSDRDFSGTHMRQELSIYLPACNGEVYRTSVSVQNETEAESADGLRSLEDTGVTEEDIVYSLSDYYDRCYQLIAEKGLGKYSFKTVIDGEGAYNDFLTVCDNRSYLDGYMNRLEDDYPGATCMVDMVVEELQGDRYLIEHKVTLQ